MIPLALALQQILALLDRMEIPYFVGGSVASGNHGFPRQTNDIDIIADFRNIDLPEFCQSLQSDFYLDLESAERAVSQQRPFNAIHLKSAFKFDFFPAGHHPFSQSELSRKRYIVSVTPGLEALEFPICSPEDSILSKLLWFRQGGEVSDRQWHDILGIISVQSAKLDLLYMHHWATHLELTTLLQAALRAAQPS